MNEYKLEEKQPVAPTTDINEVLTFVANCLDNDEIEAYLSAFPVEMIVNGIKPALLQAMRDCEDTYTSRRFKRGAIKCNVLIAQSL